MFVRAEEGDCSEGRKGGKSDVSCALCAWVGILCVCICWGVGRGDWYVFSASFERGEVLMVVAMARCD